jgi:hypothetical protein
MHRVYFDTNEGADNDVERYGLWLDKSRKDLAAIPGGPREGMIVTIYMIGELEAEAALQWDSTCNAWTARPVSDFRPNNESWG